MLKEQAKKLPLKPGVYRFLDQAGNILYIGRATVLRHRVLQYFQKDLDPRIAEMVAQAETITFETTDTVIEAIIHEANMIKKYWPKYNIKDKDDRSFVYVVFLKTDFPYPLIIRQHELKKFSTAGNIFGPYQSYYLLRQALKILRRIFPYSTCAPHCGKPCFDYQIGLCPGTCVDAISAWEYQKNIKNLIVFFKGEKQKLLKKLTKENPAQAKALKHLSEAPLLTGEDYIGSGSFSRIEGYDISHLTGKETYGSLVVFSHGQADNREYRLFKVKSAAASDDFGALSEVLARRFKHPEWPRPDLIMIDGGRPQVLAALKALKALGLDLPLVGISKYQNDALVFPVTLKKELRVLISQQKRVLLKVREEAHRFALKSSRRARTKKLC